MTCLLHTGGPWYFHLRGDTQVIFSRKCVTSPSDLQAPFAGCFAPGDGGEGDSVGPMGGQLLYRLPCQASGAVVLRLKPKLK